MKKKSVKITPEVERAMLSILDEYRLGNGDEVIRLSLIHI